MQIALSLNLQLPIAGLMSPFVGWLIDRIGVKRIYLIGILFLLIAYFTYGIAQLFNQNN